MNLGNDARFSGRHHDFVADGFSFGNISVNIAAGDHIAIGKRRLKIPTALAGQGRFVHPALDIRPVFIAQNLQRALNTVINIGQKPRPQFHRKRRAGGNHTVAPAKAGRFFVNLNGRAVAVHLNDFADQTVFADPNHIKKVRRAHSLGHDQRAGNFQNFSFYHFLPFPSSSLKRMSAPTARTTASRRLRTPMPWFPERPGITVTAGRGLSL